MKTELIQKIAVTFELCGGVNLSDAAKDMVVSDLEAYPPDAVSKALDRCRAEVRGRMSPSDIISRIDDGRPGPDEAWALCPKSEAETAVWTDEMAQAFEEVREMPDRVAARMSFRQAYERLLQAARDARKPVRWLASMGHDPSGRERVIRAAVEAGRLTTARAADLPALPEHVRINPSPHYLGPVTATPQQVRELLKGYKNYDDIRNMSADDRADIYDYAMERSEEMSHGNERATDRDAGEVDTPASEQASTIIDGEDSGFESSGAEQAAAQGVE